jgi:hypothetical protein
LLLIGDVADVAGTDSLFVHLALHVDLFMSTQLFGMDFHNFGGTAAFASVPIPNNPVLPGQFFYAQGVWVENATIGEHCSSGLFGLVGSRGLAILISP